MSAIAVVVSVLSGVFITVVGGLVLYMVQQAGQDRRDEVQERRRQQQEDAGKLEGRLQGLENAVHLLREALIARHPEMLEWLTSRGDRD